MLINRGLPFIITTLIVLTFLLLAVGCNMNNPLVLEMESAYKLPSKSFELGLNWWTGKYHHYAAILLSMSY
jgi:hypothetical protein